jgi:hypothetical protein
MRFGSAAFDDGLAPIAHRHPWGIEAGARGAGTIRAGLAWSLDTAEHVRGGRTGRRLTRLGCTQPRFARIFCADARPALLGHSGAGGDVRSRLFGICNVGTTRSDSTLRALDDVRRDTDLSVVSSVTLRADVVAATVILVTPEPAATVAAVVTTIGVVTPIRVRAAGVCHRHRSGRA